MKSAEYTGIGRGASRWIGVLLAGACIAGCARQAEPFRRHDPEAESRMPHVGLRDGRERAMQQTWVGRTRAELVRTFGNPAIVLEVPGNRLPESIILVFTGRDPAGGCIDAFVVLQNRSEDIWNYFCR